MKRAIKTVAGFIAPFYVFFAMPAFLMAILLAEGAETTEGKLFGVACIIAFPVPLLLAIAPFAKKWKRTVVLAVCMTLIALVPLYMCVTRVPYGEAAHGSGLQSVYAGSASYHRLSPANLVPEIDQLKLGTYLFRYADPFIDEAQSERIRNLFVSTYKDLRTSDEFRDVGSALGLTYRDMFFQSRPTGHMYEYVPETDKEGPMPVIIFLHGSLGNFKGYLWVWKRLADKMGVIIVAPSFGAGDWAQPGGIEAIELATEYCLDHPLMDNQRLYLAGLSNGGKGVTRAGAKNPTAYKGLIFISPLMEEEILSSKEFSEGWILRPALVIHGDSDRRIPMRYVEQAVATMRAMNIQAMLSTYEAEDHFLFFSQPDNILNDVETFLSLP